MIFPGTSKRRNGLGSLGDTPTMEQATIFGLPVLTVLLIVGALLLATKR